MARSLAGLLLLCAAAAPAVAGPDPTDRSGDLRPEAAAILDAAEHRPLLTLGDARGLGLVPGPRVARLVTSAGGAPRVLYFAQPQTIRVWRRSLDGSTSSCAGRVDTIAFEDYVKGVLPHEWIPSWSDDALEAGAVAIRTYAAYWVNAGGKYQCADLDDTTASQVYKDDRNDRASADVDATAGVYVVKAGELVFAEYSAENGDPTADGVDEPLCAGQAVNGHGHGACQWGTERWSQSGKTWDWIVTHYYPGATLTGAPPAYAASYGDASVPMELTMTSGDELVVYLEYQNDGSATWDPSSVFVGTTQPRDRASPFYKAGNWVSPSRPTGADHSGMGPGATARFTWAMVAPEVAQETSFSESYGLVTKDGQWFGPADDVVTWTIHVMPRDGSGGGGGGSGSGSGTGTSTGSDGTMLSGGCAVGGGTGAAPYVIIGLCVRALRRRRRLRHTRGL